MPKAISSPDTAMADSTPGSRGAGASKARAPNTKLATGLVKPMAATAGGSGPLAKAICTNNIPLSSGRGQRVDGPVEERGQYPSVKKIFDSQLQVNGIERVAQPGGDTDKQAG